MVQRGSGWPKLQRGRGIMAAVQLTGGSGQGKKFRRGMAQTWGKRLGEVPGHGAGLLLWILGGGGVAERRGRGGALAMHSKTSGRQRWNSVAVVVWLGRAQGRVRGPIKGGVGFLACVHEISAAAITAAEKPDHGNSSGLDPCSCGGSF